MPRTLWYTSRSPYARKVRIALLEKRLDFELLSVDFAAKPADFLQASPLGKVPALRDEDGTTVFDSTVIVEYLEDRYPEPAWLGRGVAERLRARQLDELGDTVSDQAVAAFLARGRGDDDAVTRAFEVASKALSALERLLPGTTGFGPGESSVIAALDYLRFRHDPARLAPYPGLTAWAAQHAGRPSVASTVPVA